MILRKYALILLAFVTIAGYANSLGNSFVWDDAAVITGNNFIRDPRNLPRVFSKSYLSPYLKNGSFYMSDFKKGSGEATYRPVVTLSYFLSYAFFKDNPFGYHLTNLALHAVNAALLYLFVLLLTQEAFVALFSALIFALHPVNSEAVNVIAFREDLLAFLFFFSSLVLFIRYRDGTAKRAAYMFSCVFFLLALFSKETAVALPFVVMACDYLFVPENNLRKMFSGFKSRYAAYFIILLFYLGVRFILMKNPTEPAVGYPGGSFLTNVITMSQVFSQYLRWLFLPLNIPVVLREYHHSLAHSLRAPEVFLSLALILGLFCLALAAQKRNRLVSFSIIYFFLTLAPVANIWPIANYMAARYLYLPMAGFCVVIALLFLGTAKSRARFLYQDARRSLGLGAAVLYLGFYLVALTQRNRLWHDDIGLLSSMIKQFPASSGLYSDRGSNLLKKGKFDEAVADYKKAIALKPDFALYHKQLGTAYAKKGMFAEASACLERAVQANPLDSGLRYELASLYQDIKEYGKAISAYKEAIRLRPDYLEAYNDLASVYASSGDIEEALSLWNKAIEIDPDFITAHFNLAVFHYQRGSYSLAIKHCDKVIELGGQVDKDFLELLSVYRDKG